ncbi:MAG: CVNH domain-containing protein [Alphaproteobacteria bacterium]
MLERFAYALAVAVGCLTITLATDNAYSQPAGSYQQTCRNSRMQDDTLYSSCRDTRGRYRDTSLAQVSRCIGSIWNENGALRCSRGSPPNGTYLRTCDQVRIDNGVLSAECRAIGGGKRYTSLADYQRCWSDIANVHGFLACDQGDRAAPPGTYRTTCRDRVMTGTVLKALCLNNRRGFQRTSIETANCQQPIENSNGELRCGPRPKPGPPPSTAQGYSAVEVFNCHSSRRTLVIWKASASNQNWTRQGVVDSSYSGNLCPSGSGLRVRLDAGANLIRALDTTSCGQDNPTLFNCQVGELTVVGRPEGEVLPYTVGY